MLTVEDGIQPLISM